MKLLKKLLVSVIREVIEDRERELIEANRRDSLQLYHDTTVGLWCIDKDPKEVSLEWVRENAFQLKSNQKRSLI